MFDAEDYQENQPEAVLTVKGRNVSITFPTETTIAHKMVTLMRIIDAAREERDALGRELVETLKASL